MAKKQKENGQLSEKTSFKKELFKTIYEKLDNSLVEYKEIVGEKKLNRFLKRASKEFARQAKKGHDKLAKKASKETVIEQAESYA
jgi:hypothetical protein